MDRLDLLAKLASNSECLLDIGCDHGYAITNALRFYNVKSAIASELTDVQLNNAKRTVYSYRLESKVKFVVSSGFHNVDDFFDTVIIAGMGGLLISNILLEGKNKLNNKKLILEPNKDSYIVRKALALLEYYIFDEYAIIDRNKYYEIIVALPGKKEYTDFQYKFGPILLEKKSEEFILHYKKNLEIIKSAINNSTNDEVKKIKQKELLELKEVLGE